MKAEFKQKISCLTTKLISENLQHEQVDKLINELFNLFMDLTGVKIDPMRKTGDIASSTGLVIHTQWAATTFKDALRTQKFLKGLYKAIKDQQKKHPGEKIHIVYPGPGPFGAFAIPMMSIFSSEEIEFTLIEYNRLTFEHLLRQIKVLEVQHCIKELHLGDASKYTIQKDNHVHIIISEIMRFGLSHEPHVSVTMNLISQLDYDFVLIPENVTLEMGLINLKKFQGGQNYNCKLKKVFELNINSVGLYKDTYNRQKEENTFSKHLVEIPRELEKDYDCNALFTNIQVYGDIEIGYLESGLTAPQILYDFSHLPKDSTKTIECFYQTGAQPGLRSQILWQ